MRRERNVERGEVHIPAGINTLPFSALNQLPLGRGADVAQVVSAGARDDAVPDDGLIRRVCRAGGVGPLGRDVHEQLLRVPCKEGAEVGVEVELDDGVFFLFGGVVVWPTTNTARRCVS